MKQKQQGWMRVGAPLSTAGLQLTKSVVIKPYRLDDLLQKIEDMMKLRAANPSTEPAPAQPATADVMAVDVSA
jgi:hypothetical protein